MKPQHDENPVSSIIVTTYAPGIEKNSIKMKYSYKTPCTQGTVRYTTITNTVETMNFYLVFIHNKSYPNTRRNSYRTAAVLRWHSLSDFERPVRNQTIKLIGRCNHRLD
ncbi:hypothetical protein TNCT_193811 [Trichonephila clavata]|uniref:Uncharacterized protein n=1 Tax=Trichonephila clavata TaxID=2740835 RepID=A0A8X6I1E6_TRICU|nr:hypothetical protein TNCT_193811 [Trichonephila clavata]